MPNPVYGRHRQPGTVLQLSKFTQGANDEMANFLLPIAHQDIFFRHYDFDEDSITSDFTVSNSAGGSASDFAASTTKEYGAISGSTGTTANGTIAINFDGVFFNANRAPGMLVRLKYDIVTSMYFEMGFSDVPTNAYTINWAIDTPTLQSNATTDVASIVVDTSATQKSAALVAHGSTDTTSAKTNLGATPGTTPFVAGKYLTALIQIHSAAAATALANTVSGNINGDVALSGSTISGLDQGIPLRPYIIAGTRNTAAKAVDIDYIDIWCNRT